MTDEATEHWALDVAPEGTELHTFVQWKGTDLCMDAWCECDGGGEANGSFHVCGFFAHNVQCPYCGQVYQLSTRLLARKVERSDVETSSIIRGEGRG